VDLSALMPAFMISEIRTAFEIGFMVYLPFLVVDLVIASMLISLGMIMLPPVMIALPFKLMLFVLVDGWNLTLSALVSGLQ
jgi:flagellar biosynthetic protein FliP